MMKDMNANHSGQPALVGIRELAERVGRKPHTIRNWEYSGILPKKLMPSRNERGWRVWTEPQVQGIFDWLRNEDIRPGKGLPGYKPTRAQIRSHIKHVGPKRRHESTSVGQRA